MFWSESWIEPPGISINRVRMRFALLGRGSPMMKLGMIT